MMRRAAFFLCWLAIGGAALAEFVPDADRRGVDLPPDRHGPVPVLVDFFLLDVTSVNGASETFGASLYFDLKWKDSRMAFDAAAFGAERVLYTGANAEEQLGKMWSPEIDVANITGDSQVNDKALTIFKDGTVEYEVRLAGEFTSAMELSRFPFDSQRLNVQLESFSWNANEVVLVPAHKDAPDAGTRSKHMNANLVVRDWEVQSITAGVQTEKYVTGDGYSRFVSTIQVKRNPWFYVWSVLFPLVLVTFFAFMCFFWDQETLTERVAQVLTCLLTVTAQSLAVNGDLPKISYFTRIDYAFLLTYIVLLVVAVESIFAKFLNERNHALADRIDYRSAWIVSVAYMLGMAAVFWIP